MTEMPTTLPCTHTLPSPIPCPHCHTPCIGLRCPTCLNISALACPACTWHILFPRLLQEMLQKLPKPTLIQILHDVAHDRASPAEQPTPQDTPC